MKIRTTLLLTLVFVCSLPVRAQLDKGTFEELKTLVSVMNAHLPMNLGLNMEWYAIGLDEKQLTYHFYAPITEKALQLSDKDRHYYSVAMLSTGGIDNSTRQFIRLLIDSKMSMRIVMVNKETGAKIDQTLSPDDLSNALSNNYTPEEQVDLTIANQRLSLPIKVSEGMEISQITKGSGYIATWCDVDETLLDLDELKANKEAVRKNIYNALSKDLPSQGQCRTAMNAGYGIRYVYKGNVTNQELSIDFTLDDLKDMLGIEDCLETSEAFEDDTIALPDYAEADSVVSDDEQKMIALLDWDFVNIAVPFDSEHNEELSESIDFTCFTSEAFGLATMLKFIETDGTFDHIAALKNALEGAGADPAKVKIRYVEQENGHAPIPYAGFLDEDGFFICICVCNSPEKSKALIYMTMEKDSEEDACGPTFISLIEYK